MKKQLFSTLAALSMFLVAPQAVADTSASETSKPLSSSERSLEDILQNDPQFNEYFKKDSKELNSGRALDFKKVWGNTDRTFSTQPTDDQNIGVIWWVKEGIFRDVSYRYCTASHVGGRFWLTARHCFHDRPSDIGFIETSDGSFAGIETWWLRAKSNDIALIRVGGGLTYKPSFNLAEEYLPNGSKFTTNGFYGPHGYSSKSEFKKYSGGAKVTYKSDDKKTVLFKFEDMSYADCMPGQQNCGTGGGDSGAPGYVGNTQYFVHSGSTTTEKQKTFIHSIDADVAPHTDWIRSVMRENDYSSLGNQYDAFKGGVAAKYSKRKGAQITKLKVSDGWGSS